MLEARLEKAPLRGLPVVAARLEDPTEENLLTPLYGIDNVGLGVTAPCSAVLQTVGEGCAGYKKGLVMLNDLAEWKPLFPSPFSFGHSDFPLFKGLASIKDDFKAFLL